MMGLHLNSNQHKARHDASARVCGGAAATARVAFKAMLGTVVTTKINPRWVSGGLLTEDES